MSPHRRLFFGIGWKFKRNFCVLFGEDLISLPSAEGLLYFLEFSRAVNLNPLASWGSTDIDDGEEEPQFIHFASAFVASATKLVSPKPSAVIGPGMQASQLFAEYQPENSQAKRDKSPQNEEGKGESSGAIVQRQVVPADPPAHEPLADGVPELIHHHPLVCETRELTVSLRPVCYKAVSDESQLFVCSHNALQ